MDNVPDDRFLIFLRSLPDATGTEQPLASCPTYADACRIRRALHLSAPGQLVIRFVGPTGGGD